MTDRVFEVRQVCFKTNRYKMNDEHIETSNVASIAS